MPDGWLLGLVAMLPGDWLSQAPEIERFVQSLGAVEPRWIYLAAAAGVAVENFFPPIPADTFVVLGAFLSAQGRVTGTGVFLSTWTSNTATALLSYGVARRWGRPLLATRAGRLLLRRRQLERLAALYNAHGSKIIFFSRFLPAFRSLVPVFAGISHLALWRVAIPLALASAIWYGVLVYAGTMLGNNWQVILSALENVNMLLLAIASALGLIVAVAWWKTRHHPHDVEDGEVAEG